MKKNPALTNDPAYGDIIVVKLLNENNLRIEVNFDSEDKTELEQEELGNLFLNNESEWMTEASSDPSRLLAEKYECNSAEVFLMETAITASLDEFCKKFGLNTVEQLPGFIGAYGMILEFRHAVLGLDWPPNVFFEEELELDA